MFARLLQRHKLLSKKIPVNSITRNNSQTILSSLRYKHAEFLELVSSCGDGRVSLSYRDNVAEIVLSNPARRNALSGTMMLQLADIVDSLVPCNVDDPTEGDLVGLVIRGRGGSAFCAGADLSLVKGVVNTPERGVMMSSFMTDALNRLRQSPMISVCCLNGPALGGGAELSTVGDFRIQTASENAYIQFVHAKIGASPGWGGARRLANIVGRRHAIKLCASSMRMRAEEGERIGLIDAIIPDIAVDPNSTVTEQERAYDHHFSEAAHSFLHQYSQQLFPGSLRAIKTAIAACEDATADESKAVEQDMFSRRWFGRDNVAGLHNGPLNFFKHN